MNHPQKSLFYFSALDVSGNNTKTDGVYKKILLEIRTFKELGLEVDYIYQKDGSFYLYQSGESKFLFGGSCVWRQNLISLSDTLQSICDWTKYSYFYWRFEGTCRSMHKLLYKIKQINPDCKIWAEVPTVAKKWEPGATLSGMIKFFLKKVVNKLYARHIDKVITFDTAKRIFGHPTVNIENFVDVESLPVRTFCPTDAKFHLLGVAMMTPSHGYDRVIRGIREYYDNGGQEKIVFHIIGKGPAERGLKDLTSLLGLNDSVIFEGVKTTDEISELCNKCHVAVGALAIFRKKCSKASEIKIREYCARTIPFVYSAYEPMLDNCSWCLKIKNDDSPVDLENLIIFSEKTNSSAYYSKSMRDFALANCTCQSQLIQLFNEK